MTRWIAAALLVAALLAVRGRGRHVFLVFWLLAALLHVGVPMDQQQLDGSSQFAVIVQIGLSAACGVLFSLLIATAAGYTSEPACLDITATFLARSNALATQHRRSPPAF